ncbi:MAG: peptide chain release factor N(5)-glutamine methyltransferase [Methylicorpusculum sp.]|uniref:peptide chain release factor N(5)-glutamine methyltransferase n=1 Tax=Methylicorpusculum sp. TaxID=2713644 RepID=UPI0027168693|nr:peptide chain release factor N(5)-glutamine methyltransferase [Methylicorpusculum sp.]MDO8844566.1 peptide chain release factor N(5)-glutamine methyltransferase [Methylicorpusculum sp.]MDO8938166.1 peptide chain release factor N(5)-glutamine methyltransferase [Methylicorpusculum sp.]MDO9241258.1 peptide chain release factor N(5)-glutamine methyltransferase [Methylicorpusculum sp.]MDP2177880.1 peptide chain release factor N(5)-glutamine methyltransferase [Methylicorpusculum sp.]MDP2200792.1 
MLTIKNLLIKGIQTLLPEVDSPQLEAEILLSLTLGKNRSYLKAWPEREVSGEQADCFDHLVGKRSEGIPIAYLTGQREFWSRDFAVNPDVLIPRPETELLIEVALTLIPQIQPFNVIDLGTGSGIIAITLAAERPLIEVTAVDASCGALKVAQSNARTHQTENITFIQSHWFDQIKDRAFDLVVSNPPYIAPEDPHLLTGDVRFEPQNALIAANRGLGDIEQIAGNARKHLQPQGHLLIEHGYNQHNEVQTIFREFHFQNIQTFRDLSGHPRLTYGQWQS